MKRHVWCNIRHQQPPSPGLLLDWRKDDAGDWEALVIVLTRSNAHKDFDGTATVWVPACNLSPTLED